MRRKHTTYSLLFTALVAITVGGCRPPTGPNLIDEDAPTEFTTTSSGLKYRILRKSSNPKPVPSNRIEVDYRGWLDNGRPFDNSYNRSSPTTFSLNQVIPAWTEGLQLVGEGGMIELEVPSNLGYGEKGNPPIIPPNATLHFKVELLRIIN